MIQSKQDYLYYLECDRVALKVQRKHPPFMKVAGYETWRFERPMRKLEINGNGGGLTLSIIMAKRPQRSEGVA